MKRILTVPPLHVDAGGRFIKKENGQNMKKKIILGSASPRRRELLSQIGIEFTVRVSSKKEVYHSDAPEEIVKELALMKAENVAEDLAAELKDKENGDPAQKSGNTAVDELKDNVIIGADTIVVLDRKILGKPKDEEDAFRMLQALQGREHEVYTGVAALVHDGEGWRHIRNQAVRTKVYVHHLTEEEIRSYIATGEPMDKAGGYGIQGSFAKYIDRIDGDYYNVVGLPVSFVYQTLKGMEAL